MRKWAIIIGLMVIPVLLSAQNWEFGINVSPSISYRIVGKSVDDPNAKSISNGEQGMYTFDFGFDLRKRITKRLKLGSAMLYSQKGFSNDNVGAVYGAIYSEVAQVDFIQDYFEVPIFINYQINLKGKLQFYAHAGIINAFLLHSKNNVIFKSQAFTDMEFDELEEPYLDNSADYNLGLLWGGGTQFSIDEHYSFGLEPNFKIIFSDLTEDQFSTTRNHVSAGLDFRFIRKL